MNPNPPKSSRKTSFLKKLFFIVMVCLFLLALMELVSFVIYRSFEGEFFSYEKIRGEQAVAALSSQEDPTSTGNEIDQALLKRQQGTLFSAIHPYIGCVYNMDKNSPGFKSMHGSFINKFGFVDSDLPVKPREENTVTIAVLGGSVAFWFALQGEEVLLERLKTHPLFRSRKIEIINLALGGLKQPQQLMTLNFMLALGGHFDMVLNIDGFNETVLSVHENLNNGVYPYFPRSWHLLVEKLQELDLQEAVGKTVFLRKVKQKWAQAFQKWSFPYSVSLQYLWKLGDRFVNKRISSSIQYISSGHNPKNLPFSVRGPGIESMTEENIYPQMARFWMECSLLLDQICRAKGIRYYHFLQPNQYVKDSKPMGEQERKVAYDENHPNRKSIGKGYPELQVLAGKLREKGVRFNDMTMIFADVEEPLYYDIMCHFNKKGNEIFANKVADKILEDLAATGKK
ncbi:MAG: hypothetical protein ABIK28_23980 [Planctomycetota bacterium]